MARNRLLTTMAATCLLAGACGDKEEMTGGSTTVQITTVGLSMSTGGTSGQSTTDDSGSGTAGQTTTGGTTDTTTGTTTSDTTTGTTTGDGTTTTTTTTGLDMTSTTSEDPLQSCLSQIEPGDECGECACMNCLEPLQACQADEGCSEIWECVEDVGCDGIDCYVPCGAAYDMYGGMFGTSAMLVQAYGYCVSSECPGLCST